MVFDEKINILEINKKLFHKRILFLVKKNQYLITYDENFNWIELNVSKEFFIDKKKQLITVNGNAKISDVHNFF